MSTKKTKKSQKNKKRDEVKGFMIRHACMGKQLILAKFCHIIYLNLM